MKRTLRRTFLLLVLMLLVLVALGCQGIFEDLEGLRFEPNGEEEVDPELVVASGPPESAVAGDSFTVEISLVDEGERLPGLAGHEISLAAGEVDLGAGSELVELTGSDGVASFQIVIEEARTGLVLEAGFARDEVALSATTESFDVVAAVGSEEHSSISTTDSPVADGVDEAQILVTLADRFGNPLVGVVPVVGASGEGNHFGPCSETDVGGGATCSMTSEVFGEKTLELLEPFQMTGGTVFFERPCDDVAVDDFGGGDGSSEDPYRICNPGQLGLIGANETALQRHYILLRDLDFEGVEEFSPIGDGEVGFTGRLWGGGFEIRNLKIDSPGDFVGLFGGIGEEGEVWDVAVVDVEVLGNDNVGGLAGNNDGLISGAVVTGSVEGGFTVGGVAGRNDGVIRDTRASVDVSGAVADVNDPGGTGGLVGDNSGTLLRTVASGDVSGLRQVGGLVGRTSQGDGSEITLSSASGAVEGELNGGGLVGLHSHGSITDSYATGSVISDSRAGGFAGFSSSHIANVYSAGQVEGGGDTGGMFGTVPFNDVSWSYWDLVTSEQELAAGVVSGGPEGMHGLLTADFADPDEFGQGEFSWDFDTVWIIGEAPDGALRPIHRWLQE